MVVLGNCWDVFIYLSRRSGKILLAEYEVIMYIIEKKGIYHNGKYDKSKY